MEGGSLGGRTEEVQPSSIRGLKGGQGEKAASSSCWLLGGIEIRTSHSTSFSAREERGQTDRQYHAQIQARLIDTSFGNEQESLKNG
mmetsp:Transcript_18461/g.37353  ORF Transcript_18461/g.37353 Transcript_18461/m.37353 type:complete len:87 (+) Transcript_18461:535-795(+)